MIIKTLWIPLIFTGGIVMQAPPAQSLFRSIFLSSPSIIPIMVNITSVEDCYVLHPYFGQYIVSPHLQSLVWLIWCLLIGCNVLHPYIGQYILSPLTYNP